MKNNIIVYTSNTCAFCVNAKNLLSDLSLAFKEINIQLDPEQRNIMLSKSNGQRTVPQIFINDHHVGGYTELSEIIKNDEYKSFLINE